MISLAKYYFLIHLCCVFDSNNFFIATVFYFINSPTFLTILVFMGIWVISKLGVIKWFCEYFSHFFCWIYEHIVLNISLEVYILVKFLVYTDLQCCICSANVNYWQKDLAYFSQVTNEVSFHVSIDHSEILFSKMSFWVFCQLFKGFLHFATWFVKFFVYIIYGMLYQMYVQSPFLWCHLIKSNSGFFIVYI